MSYKTLGLTAGLVLTFIFNSNAEANPIQRCLQYCQLSKGDCDAECAAKGRGAQVGVCQQECLSDSIDCKRNDCMNPTKEFMVKVEDRLHKAATGAPLHPVPAPIAPPRPHPQSGVVHPEQKTVAQVAKEKTAQAMAPMQKKMNCIEQAKKPGGIPVGECMARP